jgi:hypothetical protein
MINRPAIHLTSPRGCADKPGHLFLLSALIHTTHFIDAHSQSLEMRRKRWKLTAIVAVRFDTMTVMRDLPADTGALFGSVAQRPRSSDYGRKLSDTWRVVGRDCESEEYHSLGIAHRQHPLIGVPEVRDLIAQRLPSIAQSVASSFGQGLKFNLLGRYGRERIDDVEKIYSHRNLNGCREHCVSQPPTTVAIIGKRAVAFACSAHTTAISAKGARSGIGVYDPVHRNDRSGA